MNNIKFIKSEYINGFIHYGFIVKYNNIDVYWLYSKDSDYPMYELYKKNLSCYVDIEMEDWKTYVKKLNDNFKKIVYDMNNETNLKVSK